MPQWWYAARDQRHPRSGGSPMPDASRNRHADPEPLRRFSELVESVGIKRFSVALGLSTRQINRMRSGAQSNPVELLIRCLQCAEAEAGDRVLDFVCQEVGGHFVRQESID